MMRSSWTWAVTEMVVQVPLPQLVSERDVTYEFARLVSLSLWVAPSGGVFIVKVHPKSMVTLTVEPVDPKLGDGRQGPPIVQVKDGAPASAMVTLIGTVTVVWPMAGLGWKRSKARAPTTPKNSTRLARFDNARLPSRTPTILGSEAMSLTVLLIP